MIIKTNVPNKLYQQLLAGKTIPAKTDFKHGFSKKAYRLLGGIHYATIRKTHCLRNCL